MKTCGTCAYWHELKNVGEEGLGRCDCELSKWVWQTVCNDGLCDCWASEEMRNPTHKPIMVMLTDGTRIEGQGIARDHEIVLSSAETVDSFTGNQDVDQYQTALNQCSTISIPKFRVEFWGDNYESDDATEGKESPREYRFKQD